jgi:YD repeat-containing protein
MKRLASTLALVLALVAGHAMAQGNTATTRSNNADGSTTVTTTTTYKDGSTTTETTYDKDGHDAGTTRTDVQTKDGETTTTITKYDGAGHETGRTIERVDKDGNKTITTYDGQGHETGKKTVPKEVLKDVQASVSGIVVPDSVHDRQPFSFALTQSAAEGEVVNVQTVSGEVVQSGKSDKYGRVFLAAGLPAGAYLISRGHDAKEAGKIEIQSRPSDALQRTWEHPPLQPQLVNPPQAMKVADPLWLSGHGFNPNCSDMQVSLRASGQTHTVPVLAATEDQLKLAPVTEVGPGQAELRITNLSSGQSSPPQELLLYDLKGNLVRKKLKSGDQTTLVLNSLPADIEMRVHAAIFGQATFAGGRTEADVVVEHGRATLPVEAKKGSGEFRIDFEGQMPAPQPTPANSSHGKAACTCGCGGTAQPRCAHKACGCSS